MKSKVFCCISLYLLLFVLCSCENTDASPTDALLFPSSSDDTIMQHSHSEESTPPPDYEKVYNVSILDYEDKDITNDFISLWKRANDVYDVDNDTIFELGEYVFFDSAGYYEAQNFDEVTDSVFSPDGKAQLMNTELDAGVAFIRQQEDRFYRVEGSGNNMSYGWRLSDATVKECSIDKMLLEVKYIYGETHIIPPVEYAYVFITIIKQENKWLIDDYVYPEATVAQVRKEPAETPDYAHIRNITVTDIDGNDITNEAVYLWLRANDIYDVDNDTIFELGEYVSIDSAGYYEALNFDEVADSVFSPVGKEQLLSTELGGVPFLMEREGKLYRLGPWKTGISYGDRISGGTAKEIYEDRIVLEIKYYTGQWPEPPYNYAYIDFTIVKIADKWYVDCFVYPEATNEDNQIK